MAKAKSAKSKPNTRAPRQPSNTSSGKADGMPEWAPKAGAVGVFVLLCGLLLQSYSGGDDHSASNILKGAKVNKMSVTGNHKEVQNKKSTKTAVDQEWPWTEQTQPNVREVFARARNMTQVLGNNVTIKVLNEEPTILMIDDFLTHDQCDLMIKLAIEQGLERSTTTGKMEGGKFHRPVDDSRTSSNSWCFNSCFRNPIVNEVDKLIEWFTARPKKNMEHYQLLHYEVGQQYKEHHDFIYDQAVMSQGPRQFTFFLYLNDVEEGGETHFMKLGKKVKPKKGRAIMWPNVWYNSQKEDNMKLHPKTYHAALPVIKGEKYGANKWIHKGDFLTPWMNGVSG